MSAIAQPRPALLKRSNSLAGFALRLAVTLLILLGLWGGWVVTARTVEVTVDGLTENVRTHRHTVAGLILDLGLELQPFDRISPGLETPITPGLRLAISRAHPYRLLADGREVTVASWGQTPQAVLRDAGLAIDASDRVSIGGRELKPGDALPEPLVGLADQTYDRGFAWAQLQTEPLQLQIHRALPLTVDDGNLPFTIRTTAETVGEALRQAEITIYLGDRVQPSLGSQVSTGLRVFIERSTPLTLAVDGRLIKTRTRAKTIGAALAELKIGIAGADLVQPALDQPLIPNQQIAVTRVREEIAVNEEIIPFETVFEPDLNLEIDTQQVVNNGAPGINRQRFRIRYEDGEEVGRELLDSWVAQEATRRVIAYGQRIDPKTATLPDGTQITYWRRLRVYASSYSASTAGVPRNSPTYGRTYTGELMRTGIVAVDPRVIPLRSKLYVPGYGYGDALDTGSAILGRHIDLGYADDELVLWTKWVDIYLLWPPPPSHQIAWVLPNYPRESN